MHSQVFELHFRSKLVSKPTDCLEQPSDLLSINLGKSLLVMQVILTESPCLGLIIRVLSDSAWGWLSACRHKQMMQ